ncbi:restriction endonuclease subunit S [Mannheimia pernigra]|uniref:restriction endonuclease subunit S n=1 Tax=Mannheimia pernigra TaxID=111844 RepID=UPI0025A48FDE|nr:restriction endonuclease subunit S [Mannheimia pernigra]
MTWKAFEIGEICEIKSGVRLIKSDMQSGNIPFIGASDSNNGVTEFISNINDSLDKNVLGVNYNGSVVENFYHPYQCIFSDDVKRLEVKDEFNRNKWIYLFLKAVILKQKDKYQYGYKFNAQRMKKQKILLPIDLQGKIHFEFIEKMMMEKELSQIMKLLDYFEHKN